MKEKTVDTEGHRVKVGLDQHKSISSSSSTKVGIASPNSNLLSPTQSKPNPTAGKGSFLAPALNNSTSTAANNFDDDYNEWDISLGDLIIDLDADIEREGDKSSSVGVEKNETPNSLIDSASSSATSSDQKLFLDLSDSVSVMSSNFKSNRLSSISSSGNSASALSNNTTTTNTTVSPTSANKINILPTSPNAALQPATSTNGGHIHHFHHGHNQRSNFSPTTPNIILPNSNSAVKNAAAAAALVEHHATVDKGLKMKIKRKNIGGKNSETKHEIVSSDISPQACKPYISSFDHNSNSMPSVAPNTVSSPIIGLNSTVLNSPNSVITANAEGVLSPIGDLSTSKSSKHSNKNKSGHRDKKDKIKPDKDRLSLPVSAGSIKPNVEENAVAVSPPSTGQSIIPNLTLKYSTLSPTVIIKSDDANQNPLDQLTKSEDNISETKETGTSTSVATITEPDCLGPCEPGTSVTLEGIVWQETEGGVLVVNVTWRGKTYVGTLLDCTKHDWAPPRFCESPTSDIESKSIKNTRGKRARTNFVADNPIDTRSVTSKLRNGKGRRTTNSGFVPPSPAKSDSSVNSSKRKGRPSDLDLTSVEDSMKRNRISKLDLPDGQQQPQQQQQQQQQQPTSPILIECPEPNCSKKYKHINGLKYHQSHAHFGSSYNINDIDNNISDSTALNSAKGDGSDVEYMDDTPNMPDSPNKDIDITDKFISDTVNDSNEKEQFDKVRSDNAVSMTNNNDDDNNNNNTQNNNSQAADSKILPNCANELIVSENANSLSILDNNDKTGENDNSTVISNTITTTTTTTTSSSTTSSTIITNNINNNNSNSNNSDLLNSTNHIINNNNNNSNNFTDIVTDNVSSKNKLTETSSAFAESLNNLSDNNSREPVNSAQLDSIKHLPSNDAPNLVALSKEPTDVVKQPKLFSPPIANNSESNNDGSGTSTSNKQSANNDNIENVASPAYSDISDDTVPNDNANELVNLSSSQPSAPVEVKSDQSTSEIKKPPSSTKYNLNPFPPYYPQSQYLVPNSTVETKPNESAAAKPFIESKDSTTEKPPENSTLPNAYPPFPFYNFGSIPPHDSKYSDNIPKVSNSSLNSQAILSPPNTNKCDSDNYIKDNNANKQPPKDNSDFNSSKQIPIDELQKLKNRIPNYTFDQGSLYESQKQRYLAENEKDKSKEKMKHSPQLSKATSLKDKDDKEKKNKSQQDEGVKPTMETTGPPPPTNGYYYNPPSFLSHPFSSMSPFDSMFRGNAMNQMVMSPFGNPSPSFLHSQMRFPPMGSIESLSMPRNSTASVARSTAQLSSSGASSSSTSVKTTSHHLSSYNQNSKLPDRGGILSPTSASTNIPSSYSSLITSPSYHKSPIKSEFTGSINQAGNHCPPVSLASDQRPLMSNAPSGMHASRHPLHSTPHGYPMFDPYSAMIVNHTSNNSVPMHQFTPK